MPAGLDGHHNPIDTPARRRVIEHVAQLILGAHVPGGPTMVGIDGIDGSGKSTFADELAAHLGRDHKVVRSTIDWFHRPRAERTARGRTSPVGFYLDSHNLDELKSRLLDPFRTGPGTEYRVGAFDEPSDEPFDPPPEIIDGDEILIFDGIFIHRPELANYWDVSVFLDGKARVELDRLSLVTTDLPGSPLAAMRHTLDWVSKIDRYSSGMRYYLDLVDPAALADIVIDNNDVAHPVTVR